jgi:hypothetical protein
MRLGVAAGAARYGCGRLRPRWWLAAVPDASLPRKVVAADFNVPLDDGTIADLIDAVRLGGRGADGDTVSPLVDLLHPLVGRRPVVRQRGGPGWCFLIVLIKVLVVFGALMVSVMLMIWFERKVISDMQSRIGPNRAGPFGIAQTMADGIKLFFKEDLMPDQADRFVFKLAPYLTIIPAFLSFAIVPIGGES